MLHLSLVCSFPFGHVIKVAGLTSCKGAIVADSWLGKVKTIIYFSVAYMFGLLILFLTSLPIAIESGYTFGGLITAMILIGMLVANYVSESSVMMLTVV